MNWVAGFDEIAIEIMSPMTPVMHPGHDHYSKNQEKK
jgi:hypothetical protein